MKVRREVTRQVSVDDREMRMRYQVLAALASLRSLNLVRSSYDDQSRLSVLRGIIRDLCNLAETSEARKLSVKAEQLTKEYLELQRKRHDVRPLPCDVDLLIDLEAQWSKVKQQMTNVESCRHHLLNEKHDDEVMQKRRDDTLRKYDDVYIRLFKDHQEVLYNLQSYTHLVNNEQLQGEILEFRARLLKVKTNEFDRLFKDVVSYHALCQHDDELDDEDASTESKVKLHEAMVLLETYMLMPYVEVDSYVNVEYDPVYLERPKTKVCVDLGCLQQLP